MRLALGVEYDGSGFSGWQRLSQAGALEPDGSLQTALEIALSKVANTRIDTICAGRTDAGVHATAQAAHVDLAKAWPQDTVRDAVNAHLQQAGERVAILKASLVGDDFEARFSALGRHYLYRIANRRAPPALARGQVWWVPKRLDAETMHEAARALLGRHDFTTFRSAQCQANSPLRTLDRLDVARVGDAIEIRASARSFLHNQVRSMVGSLKKVGEGAWTSDDLKAALEARDRAACGQVVPPDGLFLVSVDY